MDAANAAIGEMFLVRTITQEQSDQSGFDAPDPAGPAIQAKLVGVFDSPSSIDDPSPQVMFPAQLVDANPEIGVALTLSAVTLDAGVDLDALRAQLDTLPNGESFSVAPADLISEYVRNSVRTQSRGLQILALSGGLAALVVLGQLLSRQVHLSRAERQPLIAVGYTSRQVVAESLWCAAVPISVGAILSAFAAYAISGRFPIGFARRLEPHPGLRAEWPVLLLGVLVVIASLLVWVGVAVSIGDRRRASSRVSPLVESLAVRIPAWAGTGLRFAYSPRERNRGSVRSSIGGLALSIAALVAALTFGSSLGRLVHDPVRYGFNYDLGTGSGGQISAETRRLLNEDPDVSALTIFGDGAASVGSDNLPIVGMEQVRGVQGPRVLSGRLPATDGEIALGRRSAKSLGLRVGKEVILAGDGGTFTFRVTGLVVLPPIGSVDGIGTGGLVTMKALRTVAPDATPNTAAVVWKPDAAPGVAERITKKLGMHTEVTGEPGTFVPPAIINLRNVTRIPDALIALLAILALITIVYVMITTMRYRDLAILRALGAQRAWLTKAVGAQAFSFVALPAVVGSLLGVLVGRALFRLLADGIGAVNEASVPILLLTIAALILLAAANLATAVPKRRMQRQSATSLLRTE